MATTFKTLLPSDVVDSRTKLHENIPITGTIVSGTYNNENIKTYSHGMFTSVFDYPFLSSSANHIFDITAGYSNNSALSGGAYQGNAFQTTQKINIYNQMAQVLVGHDATGSIRDFDEDGNLAGGTKIKEAYFVNFSRLLMKDEIKKGTFALDLYVGDSAPDIDGDGSDRGRFIRIADLGAASSYYVNSPAGEYGILYSNLETHTTAQTQSVGLVYYQAGVAVLSASIFNDDFGNPGEHALTRNVKLLDTDRGSSLGLTGSAALLTSASLDSIAKVINHRIHNVSFNNTTELNSSIYFCRANANEFNYSSNPTYLSASQIQVKQNADDDPVSYITTVGLYGANNELLAVAKLSEPIKKTPANELTVRVRLDY